MDNDLPEPTAIPKAPKKIMQAKKRWRSVNGRIGKRLSTLKPIKRQPQLKLRAKGTRKDPKDKSDSKFEKEEMDS